jgi:PAS domain S-box-containing protein
MNSDSALPGAAAQGVVPLGIRYLWQPGLLGLHVVSDALIALAYLSIVLMLLYFVRKRQDLSIRTIFVCFAIFLTAGGITRLINIWTIWHPDYWFAGVIKALSAAASLLTALFLLRVLPKALQIPGPASLLRANLALEHEIGERMRAERGLQSANDRLEDLMAERTAELETLNRRLVQDNARFAIAADAADAAGLGFWTLDIAEKALHWDELMYRLYGYSPSERRPPAELWNQSLHPEDRGRCEQESTDALAGTRGYDTEFRVVTPSGAVRHLRSTARTAEDKYGRAIQLIGVTFDVTERKRADEKFRLAIDAAPTGMLLMNLTGSIVLVNAQIEQLFGYTRDELLGNQIEMLVPARFRANHPNFRVEFFGAPTVRKMGAGRELYGLRKDGSEVPIEIGLNPLHTSEGEFVLSSIVDLSQRRAMERLRTDFVSTVSHELRTPLTSISGSLGLLQSGAMGSLSEKAEAMIRIAYNNSARLVRIINDILDIGKLEAGQLALQIVSVSLSELLQQAVESNAGYAQKYDVRFLLDDGTDNDRVLADPDRLMQVVTNLLSNAAKFSPPGTDVLIRLRPRALTMRVEVEDHGPGIGDAFKDRIFEKFAQADASASRRFEGTGLGLSIARKLIIAMNGSIGFSTVVGKGTIFYLELPRTEAAPAPWRGETSSELDPVRPPSPSAPRIAAVSDGYKILYIEEIDDDAISAIRAILAGRAVVVEAHGLHDARRLLKQEDFDLIVLDQGAPRDEHISLAERIPELFEQEVPILILADTEAAKPTPLHVAAVLVKSQVSGELVAKTILSYLPEPVQSP